MTSAGAVTRMPLWLLRWKFVWQGRLWRLDHRLSSAPVRIAALFFILVMLPTVIPKLPPLSLPALVPSCDTGTGYGQTSAFPASKPAPVCILGICLNRQSAARADQKIFGFAEFIAAMALLVVLYSIADVRYRFRLQVAPGPLEKLTFGLFTFIGVASLFSELWWAEAWPLPTTCWFLTRDTWQVVLGLLFFGSLLTWMWYAFIAPATFARANAFRYFRALLRVIVRGNPDELGVIANEIAPSADSIVKYASRMPHGVLPGDIPLAVRCAHEILLLIGDRKFCRKVVSSSPGTIQAFFLALANYPGRYSPLSAFAMNVSAEAIAQTDSFLYHEDKGFYSGWLGHVKPISQSLYGSYDILERFGGLSPLRIPYEDRAEWDAIQWGAYCSATLMAFKSYIDPETHASSSVIYGALHDIGDSLSPLSQAENYKGPRSEGYDRLRAVSDLVKGCLKALAELKERHPIERLSGFTKKKRDDIYEELAKVVVELIGWTSRIETTPEDFLLWMVHHNLIWGEFVNTTADDAAQRVFRARLFLLLRKEILEIHQWPNFRNAHVLGFLLHVLGITAPVKQKGYGEESYRFKRWILYWTKKNFKAAYAMSPHYMKESMFGPLSYDQANSRIAYTSFSRMGQAAKVTYLQV